MKQLFVTALLVVSAFAEDKATEQKNKNHAKRGVFGLGYGGYGGYGSYSGLGYSSLGYGAHGYSSLGYGAQGYAGLGHAGYVAAAPVAHAHYIQPHTHTHSVETKVVAQVTAPR